MSKIETVGGAPTRGEAFSKLIYHLDEARDQAAIIAHLHNTEDGEMDKLMVKGWLGIAELLLGFRKKVTELAMRKMQ